MCGTFLLWLQEGRASSPKISLNVEGLLNGSRVFLSISTLDFLRFGDFGFWGGVSGLGIQELL
jgi:hypothetical protein